MFRTAAAFSRAVYTTQVTRRGFASSFTKKQASATAAMAGFLSSSKFDPDKDIPSLAGRVFVVTGGSQGIGLGISSHILQHNPKKLIFVSASPDHAADAKEHLKDYGDLSNVEWVQMDARSLKNVQEVANKLKQQEPQIDVLVMNAGVGVGEFNLTPDGYDSHFQINVLGHFLLVNTLLPNIKAAAAKTKDARIVFQSSSLHKFGVDEVKFASAEEINQDIGATKLYDRSKLADAMLAFKIARDLRESGEQNVFVNATHPGLVGTKQQAQMYEPYGLIAKVANTVLRPIMKDPIDKGSRPALFAATSPDIVKEGINGEYIEVDKNVSDPSDKSRDVALQQRLWELSNSMVEHITGESF